MRRKDREIKDFEAIRQIIASCEVLRIGLSDPEDPLYPYIVPLNFGYAIDEQNEIRFFVHGARAGRKFELMQNVRCCSFQMECDVLVDPLPQHRDVTTRYKCIMGKADLTLLEGDDAVRALEILMDCGEKTCGFDWNRSSAPHTAVWELRVTELSAKANLLPD